MTMPGRFRADLLRTTLHQKIFALQAGYAQQGRTAASQQTMAALRRAALDSPGTEPALWALTLDGVPLELKGRGDEPTSVEMSIHAALVLYSLHQQSLRSPQHVVGRGLGSAVAQLALRRGVQGEADSATITRFHRLCTTQHRSTRLQELRSLMSLLRADQVPLDHAQLGVEIYFLENPARRDAVIRQWGRDLHRAPARPQDKIEQLTVS